MTGRWMAVLFVVFAIVGTGCVTPVNGVLTSDERWIWLIRGGSEVYRCADGAAPDAPPRPMCVKTVFIDSQ